MNGIWSTSPIGQSSLVCSPTTTYFVPLTVTRHFNLGLSDRENDPSSFCRAVHGRRTTPRGRGVPCRGRGFVPPRLASSPIACTTTAMPKGFFVHLCKALSMAQNATPMQHDASRQPWSVSPMPRMPLHHHVKCLDHCAQHFHSTEDIPSAVDNKFNIHEGAYLHIKGFSSKSGRFTTTAQHLSTMPKGFHHRIHRKIHNQHKTCLHRAEGTWHQDGGFIGEVLASILCQC